MKTVVCLNGPPRTGKDTLARMFVENCVATRHCENKAALIRLCLEVSGVSKTEWYARYSRRRVDKSAWFKDVPWDSLPKNKFYKNKHFSQREFLIYMSEDVIKPHFGEAYFGKRSADLVKDDEENDTFVFSDGGFYPELLELAKLEDTKVILVRLRREGCNFDNDSRDYLYSEDIEMHDIYVGENQIDKAYEQIYNLVF